MAVSFQEQQYRAAPYLHDVSASGFREVIFSNKDDQLGETSHLSRREIDDLVVFLQSL